MIPYCQGSTALVSKAGRYSIIGLSANYDEIYISDKKIEGRLKWYSPILK